MHGILSVGEMSENHFNRRHIRVVGSSQGGGAKIDHGKTESLAGEKGEGEKQGCQNNYFMDLVIGTINPASLSDQYLLRVSPIARSYEQTGFMKESPLNGLVNQAFAIVIGYELT